jgi:hypothetical protein
LFIHLLNHSPRAPIKTKGVPVCQMIWLWMNSLVGCMVKRCLCMPSDFIMSEFTGWLYGQKVSLYAKWFCYEWILRLIVWSKGVSVCQVKWFCYEWILRLVVLSKGVSVCQVKWFCYEWIHWLVVMNKTSEIAVNSLIWWIGTKWTAPTFCNSSSFIG